METLANIRKRLTTDGRITDEETKELRHILFDEDEGMNLEKANFLFELKDLANKKHVSPALKELFIEAIVELLLNDEESPGEIDDSEAKWLRAKVQSKGYMDSWDKALFAELKHKAINYPDVLNYKGPLARRFEYSLYFTRYLTLIAVFGSLIGAIALFIKGGVIVVETSISFVIHIANPDYNELLTHFVSSVDIFLFAMVLIIFGVGIYELFISKIDPVERKMDGRPTWMRVSSIDDLKSSLGKVIIMVLIVTFFKYSIDIEYNNVNDLIKLGVGVVLVALALFITAKSHH